MAIDIMQMILEEGFLHGHGTAKRKQITETFRR